MIRNCTGCSTKHEYPWGPNKCKNLPANSTMSESDHTKDSMAAKALTREDPDYMANLEAALLAAHRSREEDSKLMKEISDRLGNLELREASRQDAPAQLSTAQAPTTPWSAGAGGIGRQGAPGAVNTVPHRPTTPGVGRGVLSAATRFFQQPGIVNQGNIVGGPVPTNTGLYQHQNVPSAASGGGGMSAAIGTMSGQQFWNSTIPGVPAPAPSDIVTAPLTSALEQLSNAIDPTSVAKSKGMNLRPEFYVQHVDQGVQIKSLDHTKLTYRELVSGMGRVMMYLSQNSGDVLSYIQHFNFIAAQAHKNNFTDQAFVCYERDVTDKVIRGDGRSSFVAGDPLAVASNFHAGNLLINKRTFKPNRYPRNRRSYNQGQDHSERDSMPEGFPEDICYGYNYRSCSGRCSKSHICRLCRGKHKASGCGKEDKNDKKPVT